MLQKGNLTYEMPAGVLSMTLRIFLSPARTAIAPSGSTSMMTTSPSCEHKKKMCLGQMPLQVDSYLGGAHSHQVQT